MEDQLLPESDVSQSWVSCSKREEKKKKKALLPNTEKQVKSSRLPKKDLWVPGNVHVLARGQVTHLIRAGRIPDRRGSLEARPHMMLSPLFEFHWVTELAYLRRRSRRSIIRLCVQGLANESSNHSYGSLGSSSDKESEVRMNKDVHNLDCSAKTSSSLFFSLLSLPLLPPLPLLSF